MATKVRAAKKVGEYGVATLDRERADQAACLPHTFWPAIRAGACFSQSPPFDQPQALDRLSPCGRAAPLTGSGSRRRADQARQEPPGVRYRHSQRLV